LPDEAPSEDTFASGSPSVAALNSSPGQARVSADLGVGA